MEQKLAEFRARRQAENAIKKEKIVAPLNQAEPVDTGPETTSTSDREKLENTRESPQTSPTKVRQCSTLKFTVYCDFSFNCSFVTGLIIHSVKFSVFHIDSDGKPYL